MSITTDFKNMPILDVDYGASNMAGFSGENYHDWTYEQYLERYVNKVKGKSAIKSQNKRHKQQTPIFYKDARK